MKTLRANIYNYLPDFMTAFAVLAISFLIIIDGRFIFVFSAVSLCFVLALLALKFPTIPLYLLLLSQFGDAVAHLYYDEIRVGGMQVLVTDPAYVIIVLATVLAVVRDPGVISTYWNFLRGGIFLGFAFAVMIVMGYMAHGYSAVAEFRGYFLVLFIPFYCFSARLSADEWVEFLRRSFWLSALVIVPHVAIAISEGARPFSPGHRFLDAETHLWLAISLFLLWIPGLIRRGVYQSFFAWLIAGGYCLLILSDAHRSVWLMSLTVLLTIWFLDRGEFRKLRIVTVLLCFTVVPLVAYVLIEGQTAISQFIVSRAGAYISPEQDATASWRLWLWQGAWEIFMKNPVMGIGLGTYYDDVWRLLTGVPKGPSLHNFYITLLLKGGIILAILYGWYVLSIARTYIHLRKKVAGRWDVYTTLGIALLIGTLVYQVPYGASLYLLVFTGSLLALGLASIRENAQGEGESPGF
jgi:O-antigen ligase